ncbi:MAG: ABC transporter substrate-binding protein [Deltaproteobacteria bacterium]|nr:ABC transporter substrate-binding protein [Deltaproteobacteria bacterium]
MGFEIRQDARFHDGSPIEASDVVASLGAYIQNSMGLLSDAFIARFQIINNHSFSIKLSEPSTSFLRDLHWPILPRQIALEYSSPRHPVEPVGSGQFLLKRSEKEFRLVPSRKDSDAGATIVPRFFPTADEVWNAALTKAIDCALGLSQSQLRSLKIFLTFIPIRSDHPILFTRPLITNLSRSWT